MFDPVWFGNYVVPRWEALLLLSAAGVAALIVVFAVVTALSYFAWAIWDQFRF